MSTEEPKDDLEILEEAMCEIAAVRRHFFEKCSRLIEKICDCKISLMVNKTQKEMNQSDEPNEKNVNENDVKLERIKLADIYMPKINDKEICEKYKALNSKILELTEVVNILENNKLMFQNM